MPLAFNKHTVHNYSVAKSVGKKKPQLLNVTSSAIKGGKNPPGNCIVYM